MEQAIRDRIATLTTSCSSDGWESSSSVDPSSIHEMLLDGRQFSSIDAPAASLLSQFPNLTKLTCNQTSLATLAGFPPLPSLRAFELTDNHITGGLEALLTICPNVKRLELGGNHIKTMNCLEPLAQLPHLEHLGLAMNPVVDQPTFRVALLQALPQVKVLDGIDRMGDEVDMSSDDDEEDENDDEEEADNTLKDFYEKDYEEDDDGEDQEDFSPQGEEEEDEVLEEEEDDDDDEEMESPSKRKVRTCEAPGPVDAVNPQQTEH